MSTPQATRPPRRALPIVLGAAAVVLLGSTIALGATTARLLGEASQPSSTASPDDEGAEQDAGLTQPIFTTNGIEVRVNSDFTLESLAIGLWNPNGYVSLFAPIHLTGPDEMPGRILFDITTYDADGHILNRSPTNLSWQSGQKDGTLEVNLRAVDLTKATAIVVEQTLYEEVDFALTGAISVTDVQAEDGFVTAVIESSLSQPLETARITLAAFADGELFGVCGSIEDIPAGGTLTFECVLDAVGTDRVTEQYVTQIPQEAEFRVTLDLPSDFGP